MNELHYAYFDEEEIEYIEEAISEILEIYILMEWEPAPDYEMLTNHVCDSILEIRADETLSYAVRWRVKIQNDPFSPIGQEISLTF